MLPGSRPPVLAPVLLALALALGLGAAPAAGAPAEYSAAGASSPDRAADQLVVAVNRKRAAAARKVATPAVVTTLLKHRRAGLRYAGREVNPCTGKGARRSCAALLYRGKTIAGYVQATATRRSGSWTITGAEVRLF